MRISFSTAALYPRSSKTSLSLLASCGYKEAELMPQCLYETTPAFGRDVSNLGLRVSSIHFPLCFFSIFYNPYHGMIKEAEEMMDNLLESGRIMGTEVIVIHPLPEMEGFRREIFYEPVIGNIKKFATKAEKEKIVIALENNPNTRGKSSEGLLKIIEEIDHPNLKPMVDSTESWEAGIEPEEFIEKVKPIHLHLSDFKEKYKHLPIGEGKGDWEEIVKTIYSINYEGIYVIEPAYRYYTGDIKEKLINNKLFLEKTGELCESSSNF